MGIKKSTFMFSQDSLIHSNLIDLRQRIIADKDEDPSYKPCILIDGNIWVMAAISNPQPDSKISTQFHAVPMVPVTEAAKYVMKRIKLLEKYNFIPIFCLDGKRFPLKEEETEARHGDIEYDYSRLYYAYLNPDEFDIEDVFQLRKKTMYPREDLYDEIKKELDKNGVHCISGAYEADFQFVAMQNQHIIDAVVTKDTDSPAMGIKYTVTSYV